MIFRLFIIPGLIDTSGYASGIRNDSSEASLFFAIHKWAIPNFLCHFERTLLLGVKIRDVVQVHGEGQLKWEIGRREQKQKYHSETCCLFCCTSRVQRPEDGNRRINTLREARLPCFLSLEPTQTTGSRLGSKVWQAQREVHPCLSWGSANNNASTQF